MLERRLIDERTLIEVLSLQMGFPYVEPDYAEIDTKLFHRVPPKWYESHSFIPVRRENGTPPIRIVWPTIRGSASNCVVQPS